MDLYFLHHDEFKSHYNCSMMSDEEWGTKGSPNVLIGSICLAMGVVCLFLYIPCIVVMRQPELFKHSCYKMMVALGIIDCFSVVYNCIFGGYFSLVGAVACPHIVFHYFVGASSVAVWSAQCLMCILLAVNRCSDLWNVPILQRAFEGKHVYGVIALPLIYGLCVLWFGQGCMFSSNGNAYFFDPYIFISDVKVDRSYYTGYLLSFNNTTAAISLSSLHAFLLASVYWKSRGASTSNLTKMQRQLFVQAFAVCSLNFMAASLYVLMQYVNVPYAVILTAEFTWQGATGGAVFIYLILNRTIRRGILSLLFGLKLQKIHHVITPSYSRTSR
ncbi:hypothetical protein QR680_016275 [Steinernema hermaphroditum]|uniref:7TM GPCR serpentine receptor class x (Srx) domain-containing protein n=1 Tax=Steinernema hermaphroditum TaxID=289476 RepID=A0AA39HBS1_9BILA|nr:hypothetical protein QR680_016275 [Steinernema hermaphroditum]